MTTQADPITATVSKVRLWRVLVPVALVALTCYGLFRLPFHFPPRQRLVSVSYAFGFNNAVGILSLAAMLGVAALYRLTLRPREDRPPLLAFPDDPSVRSRPSTGLFILMAVVYAILSWVLYEYTHRSGGTSLTWESRHFLHRIKLIETYDLRGYVDVQAEYGPALLYPPIYLHRLLAPLGVSAEAAYFLCHAIMNIAGLGCLWYLLRGAAAPARAKSIAFVIVGLAGFAPYMGLNGIVLRYACPFASVLLAHRTWMRMSGAAALWRWPAMFVLVALLLTANVLLSPEIAVAFALAWTAYVIFAARKDWRLAIVSIAAIAATAVACRFTLPESYYGSLLRFSQGANNLPILPAAHILLFVATLGLLVPPLLAAALRGKTSDSALLGSLGVLCVVTMPGALGRCDPPHVLLYGLPVSILLMAAMANVSRRAFRAYAIAYVLVFIGIMQLVNLNVFFNVSRVEMIRHPSRALHRLIDGQRQMFAPRDTSYLAALDRYSSIGLPYATYGGDSAADAYLFEHRRLHPEFYVGGVGIYTQGEVDRKLADIASHEYMLVGERWNKPWIHDLGKTYNDSLRLWFVYPARLKLLHADLDSYDQIDRFIVQHFRAVETIGGSVLVKRIDSNPTTQP